MTVKFTGSWWKAKIFKRFELDTRATKVKGEYITKKARRTVTRNSWAKRTDAANLNSTTKDIVAMALTGLTAPTAPATEYGERIEDVAIIIDYDGVAECVANLDTKASTWTAIGGVEKVKIGAPYG